MIRMTAAKTSIICLLSGLVLGAGLSGPARGQDVSAEFEQLKERVQQPSGGATEQEARRFLELALEQGRPVDGALAIKPYLVMHRAPDPELLRLSADVARLACAFDDAVTRYKSYLRESGDAEPSQALSEALVNLLRLQVEVLDDYSGAFNAIEEYGHRLRADARIQKFDRWYIQSAMDRADRVNQSMEQAARQLLVVFRDQHPLEMERLLFWPQLDRLMASLYDKAREERYAPLQYLEDLVSLIREDEARKLRYDLYVKNQVFLARSAGKPAEQLNEDYATVIEAARAYFAAAPTADTLRDIVFVFTDGNRNWTGQAALEYAFFAEVFPKLSDDDKSAILKWDYRPRLADAEHWVALGAAAPGFFNKHASIDDFRFGRELPGVGADAGLFTRCATFMAGVPTEDAAAVNALAEGIDDPAKAIAHLFEKESWHLGFDAYQRIFVEKLWPVYEKLLPADKTSNRERAKWIVEIGKRAAATPVALFDTGLCREYVRSTIYVRDPAALQAALAALEWVPFSAGGRRHVFETAYAEFKRWRGDAEREKESNLTADLAKAIDQAFTAQLAENATANAGKVPSSICKDLSEVLDAQRNGDAAAYVVPARRVYAAVKTYNEAKPAFGGAAFRFILNAPMDPASRKPVIDILDFQCEVLDDQLKAYKPGPSEARIRRAFALVGSGRNEWERSPRTERENLAKVNDVIVAAMMRQMDAGSLWPALFEWYLRLRLGQNRDDGYRLDVIDRLVAELKTGNVKGLPAAWRIMYYINANYFTGAYREKYDTQYGFEAIAAREMREAKTLDNNYYQYGGRDKSGDICNVAATLLMPYDVYPLGYGGVKPPCEVQHLSTWYSRALSGYTEATLRSQLRQKLGEAYGKTRFDEFARTSGLGQGPYDVEKRDGSDSLRFLREWVVPYLDRIIALADRPPLGRDFYFMRNVAASALSDEDIAAFRRLFTEFMPPSRWQSHYSLHEVLPKVQDWYMEKGRESDLYALIPGFWTLAKDANRGLYDSFAATATKLDKDGKFGLAYAYAQAGLSILTTQDREGVLRVAMQDVTAHARREIGTVIPVPEGDPKYPVFMAQSFYYDQDGESAWRRYRGSEALVTDMIGQLDPDFAMWLIEKHTDLGEFEQATRLAQSMLKWVDDTRIAIDPEIHGKILIRYASIAFAQEEYPRAKAQLERVTSSQIFEETQARLEAGLKLAEIDRLTENYDGAVSRLSEIKRKANAYVQTLADIEMAKVSYAQEDFAAARDTLQDVISQAPQNVDAKLMLGEVDLKLKNLMDARDLPIGIEGHRHEIVPGKTFKVGLHDRNAAVVGQSEVIPLRIWTDSGDEEIVKMLPAGDVRRKFQGQIETARAPLAVGDGMLQVLGQDKVYYDFTEAFKKSHNIGQSQTNFLNVVSDGSLQVSSGRILTEEELEKQRVETALRARLRDRLGPQQEVEAVALSERRQWDQVKPGHSINVRVVDLDHSVTAEPDTLTVSASTVSGDRIAAVPLTETEGHSGDFRGQIKTAPAQATAYASDSLEGRDPNFAISPKSYPAWMGATEVSGNRVFGVDLNDNVSFGRMRLVAKEKDHKLRRFALRTGYNRDNLELVGLWPGGFEPWDGSLDVRLYKLPASYDQNGKRLQYEFSRLEPEFLRSFVREVGVERDIPAVKLDKSDCQLAWTADAGGHARALQLRDDDTYIIRMRGAFYVPLRSVRTFELIRGDEMTAEEIEADKDPDVFYVWSIDGIGTRGNREALGPNVIKRSFEKGVHVLELYVLVRKPDQMVSFEVQSDAGSWGPRREMKRCDSTMFDPEQEPRIRSAVYRAPAEIEASEDKDEFEITFSDTKARIVSVVMTEYEGDAPAISKLELTNTEGEEVLPTPEDFMDLRQNDILEVLPGDVATVKYEDPRVVGRKKGVHTDTLSVTFTDGSLHASYIEYVQAGGGVSRAVYVPMVRFLVGEPLTVFINDPDLDASDKRDTTKFKIETTSGDTLEGVAVEQQEHSAVFIGKVFPVSGDPKRKGEFKCREDETVTITYFDEENVEPGIPWPREVLVDSSFYVEPEVRVYGSASTVITNEADIKEVKTSAEGEMFATETYYQTRSMLYTRQDMPLLSVVATNRSELSALLGPDADVTRHNMAGSVLMEVVWPTVTLTPVSKVAIFAQTSSGRAKLPEQGREPFDLRVPGTIRLETSPGAAGGKGGCGPQYEVEVEQDPYAAGALIDGRYTFMIPLKLGETPVESFVQRNEEGQIVPTTDPERRVLYINGDDDIVVGFQFADDAGVTNWVVRRIDLTCDGFLDVMDRRYEEPLLATHVGEKIYFRVVEKARDLSNDKDTVDIVLRASSGAVITNRLYETFEHTGVFKGYVRPMYAGEPGSERADAVPVKYGDDLTVEYTPRVGDMLSKQVSIFKGADGSVHSFTRKFKDPEIAVSTQFAIAEAYFELAKRHRVLNQISLARREINHGKKLLEETLRDFPDTKARDQAEYLLANLALEFANDAKNESIRESYFMEAVTRFGSIVQMYPDSEYAPKSQFKLALSFEKMGNLDQSSEEYVKLAYKYPDHELIAETIARLGQYFWTKGKGFKDQVAALREAGTPDDLVEAERIEQQIWDMYNTAGDVFGRLSERFPNHKLAGKTKLLSGQAYMQALNHEKAVEVLNETLTKYTEDADLAAETAYWLGHCQMLMGQAEEAYIAWKKLTFDHPASTWAKYARGRLTDPKLIKAQESVEAKVTAR